MAKLDDRHTFIEWRLITWRRLSGFRITTWDMCRPLRRPKYFLVFSIKIIIIMVVITNLNIKPSCKWQHLFPVCTSSTVYYRQVMACCLYCHLLTKLLQLICSNHLHCFTLFFCFWPTFKKFALHEDGNQDMDIVITTDILIKQAQSRWKLFVCFFFNAVWISSHTSPRP